MLGLMPSSTSHKALPLAQHGAALLPKNMPAEAHCQEDRGINAVELVFIMTFLGYFSLFNVQIVSVVSCCGFHRLLYTTTQHFRLHRHTQQNNHVCRSGCKLCTSPLKGFQENIIRYLQQSFCPLTSFVPLYTGRTHI
jgi:hypothetical protein